MTKTELAYLAGVFDGEGCVMLARDGNDTYCLSVKISMCDKPILQKFRKAFGGSLLRLKRPASYSKYKAIYMWQISTRKAEAALSQLQPYLIGKLNQVNTALRYQKSIPRSTGNRLTQRERDRRRAVYLKLQRMKKVQY